MHGMDVERSVFTYVHPSRLRQAPSRPSPHAELVAVCFPDDMSA
jgi:hypothetical protein